MVLLIKGWLFPNDGFNFWRNRPDDCGDLDVGVSGECILPRTDSLERVAQNDRGGGGGVAPKVLSINGGLFLNDVFKFWRNQPDGCGDMGVGIGGECILPRTDFLERAAQNDRGSGGGAAPMVILIKGGCPQTMGSIFGEIVRTVAEIWASASAALGGGGQISSSLGNAKNYR
jgi:hypothetical protein